MVSLGSGGAVHCRSGAAGFFATARHDPAGLAANYAAAVGGSSQAHLHSGCVFTVYARIFDKDNLFTEYQAEVTVDFFAWRVFTGTEGVDTFTINPNTTATQFTVLRNGAWEP